MYTLEYIIQAEWQPKSVAMVCDATAAGAVQWASSLPGYLWISMI